MRGKIAGHLERRLATVLGPHTARVAVKMYARRATDRAPEELRPQDLRPVLEAMRPMLSTLLGTPRTAALIEELDPRPA